MRLRALWPGLFARPCPLLAGARLSWRAAACCYRWPARSRRSSRIRSMAVTVIVTWPAPGSRCARAPGMCAASHRPCANGTMLSWSPCQIAAPAGDAVADGAGQALGQVGGELTGQHRRVGTGDESAERGGDLLPGDPAQGVCLLVEERGELVRAADREAELLDVLRSHACQEVQAVHLVGGDAGDRGGPEAAPGRERGARQGVRPATGEADRHQLVSADRAEYDDDVGE